MAFTTAQKIKIRKYLGYPQVFEGDNYRLEGALTVIGADADKQAYVVGLLDELDTLDAAIAAEGSSSASYGAIKRADEVEFYEPSADSSAVDTMRRASMVAGRLSQALGVPIAHRYFGSRGYVDEAWRGDEFQVGEFPLG